MNRARIERDAAVQLLALEQEWARAAYAAFGQWLLQEQPDKPNLAKTFSAHFPFFARLDAAIEEERELQGNGLLDHFRVAELREHLLSVRFLEHHLGVSLDEEAKQVHVERGRIAEKLIAARRAPCGSLLKRYVDWLDRQKTPPRTIRLYLTAASQLCLAEGLAEDRPCQSVQLQRFLRKHPGLRASLFRWTTYCRTVLEWDIKMPAPTPRKSKPPRTVRELSVLLAKIEASGLEHAPVALLQRAVAKAFGFPAKHMSPSVWSLRMLEEEVYLSSSAESIRVPVPMRELVATWIRRASG